MSYELLQQSTAQHCRVDDDGYIAAASGVDYETAMQRQPTIQSEACNRCVASCLTACTLDTCVSPGSTHRLSPKSETCNSSSSMDIGLCNKCGTHYSASAPRIGQHSKHRIASSACWHAHQSPAAQQVGAACHSRHQISCPSKGEVTAAPVVQQQPAALTLPTTHPPLIRQCMPLLLSSAAAAATPMIALLAGTAAAPAAAAADCASARSEPPAAVVDPDVLSHWLLLVPAAAADTAAAAATAAAALLPLTQLLPLLIMAGMHVFSSTLLAFRSPWIMCS